MNLKQRVFGTLGAVTLGLSLTSGIVMAQGGTTDEADTVVNVTCPYTTSVDVNVNGSFDVDSGAGAISASLPGGFEIVLDLTCNWTNDFQVGATIGTFAFDGTAPSGSASSFSGSHLLLQNGAGVYTGPTSVIPAAGPPDVEATVFELLQTTDPDVIENDVFIIFPLASPGETTATWDGSLNLLPLNLANGTYTAPLTVTLTVN